MKGMVQIAMCLLALAPSACPAGDTESPPRVYDGVGHVSAAVAVAKDAFITGSGQDNTLRIYRTAGPATAIASLDVSEFLGLDGECADIQGAAKVGDRVYWITSHSRDEEGQIRPERYQFFATTVKRTDAGFEIEPLGKPCTTLLKRLPNLNTVSTLRLDQALRLDENLPENQRRKLAPTREGLRIEALCADPRTDVLFLGFRNPRPVRVTTGRVHALVIPLNNATDVVEKGREPIFGEAMLWDFDGLGITAFEYSPTHGAYFILAQPHNADSPARLYRWSGMKANAPESVCTLCSTRMKTNATAITAFEDSNRLLLPAGSNTTPTDEHFQGIWIRP